MPNYKEAYQNMVEALKEMTEVCKDMQAYHILEIKSLKKNFGGFALKSEYADFMDSIHDPMDPELGEIYRDKLVNIFRILKQEGVEF